MCPKGDDPLTIDQNNRQFRINVHASSYLSGTLGIQFMAGTVVLSLSSPSSAECIDAFENSQLFQYVNCKFTKILSVHYQYDVTIYSWPTYPQENNLHSHDGNPAITEFYCDISSTDGGVYCLFEDIVKDNVRGKSNVIDFLSELLGTTTRLRSLFHLCCIRYIRMFCFLFICAYRI